MIPDEFKGLLKDEVWTDCRVRLTAFAFKEIKEQFWNGADDGPLLGGKDAADYVSEALIDVLCGEEPWDSTRYNFRTHLKFVIGKKIHNALRRHEATRVTRVESEDEFGLDHDLPAIATEVEAILWLEGFSKFLEGEDDLQLLVLCMKEGKLKPADIAESLGVSVSEVTTMARRLHRRAWNYQKRISLAPRVNT